jgi:hypothetical protein
MYMSSFRSVTFVCVTGIFAFLLFGVGCHGRDIALSGGHVPVHIVGVDTSAPVKVRGGAMTFYTTDKGVWQKQTKDIYCTNVPSLNLATDGFDRKAILDGAAATWAKITISAGDVGANKIDAITIVPSTKDCKNGNTGPSVTITRIGGDRFYNDDKTIQKAHLRFSYAAPNCKAADEDICERISQIDVVDSVQGDLSTFNCPDYDCAITIGKQP